MCAMAAIKRKGKHHMKKLGQQTMFDPFCVSTNPSKSRDMLPTTRLTTLNTSETVICFGFLYPNLPRKCSLIHRPSPCERLTYNFSTFTQVQHMQFHFASYNGAQVQRGEKHPDAVQRQQDTRLWDGAAWRVHVVFETCHGWRGARHVQSSHMFCVLSYNFACIAWLSKTSSSQINHQVSEFISIRWFS